MYSEKVMEHFKNPRNFGKMDNPDAVGKVGNLACGDVMYIYIKVGKRDGKEVIDDIKFETMGCAAAIATSSMVTELAKGRALDEVLELSKQDVEKDLGGLPPVKQHCSSLAADGLHEAVYEYFRENGRNIPEKLEKEHEKIKKTWEKMEG